MTDLHARARELFMATLERPADERSGFLEAACGDDDELRREISSLLAFHHQDDDTVAYPGPIPRRVGARADRFSSGQVFAGRYRIVSELGRGGMGEVYRADDLVLGEAVALKFLPRGDNRHYRHLLEEVRIARQVTHTNVCRVYDFGEADGETFMTMEYIDGEDLSSLLTRIGRFPRDKLLDVAHQLCAGLAAAHEQGVLHRDLKPANIMIDGRGQARIADFGIAYELSPATTDSPSGAEAAIVGTVPYMAPERLEGAPATAQTDLYALGLVLHEMATGQPVFSAETPAGYVELHRSAVPSPPSRDVEYFDPRVEAVILQCLAKDPADRPASARSVAAALPSADRLQLALEAGSTPSADAVAESKLHSALRPVAVALLAAGVVVALAATLALADRAYPSRRAWRDTPPEVLARDAADLAQTLGHVTPPALDGESVPPTDRKWGFVPIPSHLPDDGSGHFWYRQGPDRLVPTSFFSTFYPRVETDDPPLTEDGMLRLSLDAGGRLVELTAASAASRNATAQEIDWLPLLAATGFAERQLQAVKATRLPPVMADQQAAWRTVRPGVPVRIEAAALGDRIVHVDVRPEITAAQEESQQHWQQSWDDYVLANDLVWLALAIAAIILARINLRAGRGDLYSAKRLAIFVVAAKAAIWLLELDHLPPLDSALPRLQAGLGSILVDAIVAWLAYIALEPVVRRWRPTALISWTRLLRGRVLDPLVGRSLLIGCLVGSVWALLTLVDRLAANGLGIETAPELFVVPQLEVALSGRLLSAHVLGSAVDALYWGVLDLFLLVGLRVLVRRWWVAIAVFVLANGALETMEGIHPTISWLTLGIGIAGGTALLLVRFGLLTYVVALFSYFVLITAPVTLAFEAWFAESGLSALALVLAIAGFGAWRCAEPSAGPQARSAGAT